MAMAIDTIAHALIKIYPLLEVLKSRGKMDNCGLCSIRYSLF